MNCKMRGAAHDLSQAAARAAAVFHTPVRHREAGAVRRTAARPATPVAAETPTRRVTPARPATVAAIITAAMAEPTTGGVTEAGLLLGRLLAQL